MLLLFHYIIYIVPLQRLAMSMNVTACVLGYSKKRPHYLLYLLQQLQRLGPPIVLKLAMQQQSGSSYRGIISSAVLNPRSLILFACLHFLHVFGFLLFVTTYSTSSFVLLSSFFVCRMSKIALSSLRRPHRAPANCLATA